MDGDVTSADLPDVQRVSVAGRGIGPGEPCFVVAEIGINHNGDIDLAKRLIDVAANAGCDAVKFQKRTVDVVYTEDELAKPRESPFGETNGDLKRGLEFGFDEYMAIDAYCRERGILWFASCWDEASVDFMDAFEPPCYKIASALLTHLDLLLHTRRKKRPLIMSTGMSTSDEIDEAVRVLGRKDLVLLHTNSSYPAALEELNLAVMHTLRERYEVPVGYSGHEVGLATTLAASAMGAAVVERHITLDRAMWGSDHAASIEPQGLTRLVRDIRAVERATGNGEKTVYESELPFRAKLRRVG
jgi:N-acetylneuraminate synthase